MFTGLIEEKGYLKALHTQNNSSRLVIGAKKVLEGTTIGDSIAVNGICLTVTDISKDSFTADAMPETLKRSSLGALKIGSPLHLERAMAAGGRFGGHIVSGHIDGTGVIKSRKKDGNALIVTISAHEGLLAQMVEKGSIAIDGVSLTIISMEKDGFSVGLIPHTAGETVLADKGIGDVVNLETDIIAKYVQSFVKKGERAENTRTSYVTMELLRENGF